MEVCVWAVGRSQGAHTYLRSYGTAVAASDELNADHGDT